METSEPIPAPRQMSNKMLSKSLQTEFSAISGEWHPVLNGNLGPDDVTRGSHRKVWWIGSQCGHEYEARVYLRVAGNRCPYCFGQRVCRENSLGRKCPHLVKEWHESLNGDTTPYDIRPQSNKKFWWQCEYQHIWSASPSKRTIGRGCPKCRPQHSMLQLRVFSEIKHIFPDADYCKNVDGHLEFDIFIPTIKTAIEYDGFPWHQKTKPADERKNAVAKSLGINLIRVRDQRLEKLTDNDLIAANGRQICLDDIKKIFQKISENIEDATINSKIASYLHSDAFQNVKLFEKLRSESKRVIAKQNLAETHPIIAQEWDIDGNGRLRPEMFTSGSAEKVQWKCKKDPTHKWSTTISNRCFHKKGCPYCSGRTANDSTSLLALYPHIAKDWYYDKNGTLRPESIRSGSGKRVFWRCEFGHCKEAIVQKRVETNGCVDCKRAMRSWSRTQFLQRSL